MAKRPIWKRKTRIRHVIQRMAEQDIDTIDSFRAHIEEGAVARRSAIERLAAGLSDDQAQDYLADNFADNLAELDVISALGNEFAIVGLYRVVEVLRGRILRARYGSASPNTAYMLRVRDFLLKHHGIDVDRIPHYRAINELRLLNNAIKRDAAVVTAELAQAFPRWKEGKRLTGLDAAYERLKSHVASYIFAFATRVKLTK